MTDLPPDSPCKNICELDADSICIGCGRSTSEIAGWISASNEEKTLIIQRAAIRLRLPESLTKPP